MAVINRILMLVTVTILLVWMSIASTTPVPGVSTDDREEKLINELQRLRLMQDLENELTNAIQNQDDGVNDQILEQMEQLRLLQEQQLSSDVDSPSNEVKVLEEHFNLPTEAPSTDDNDADTILDNDSLELELFQQAGTDEQGNRIYTETDHLEEELQTLVTGSDGTDAVENELDELMQQLESLSGSHGSENEIDDLVDQLENLSHDHDKSSGNVTPTMASVDETSDEDSSEATSMEVSAGGTSLENSSEENSSGGSSSGEDGSGDEPNSPAVSDVILSVEEDGSGIYEEDKLALEAEGLSLVTDGNVVAVEEESSGTEMSGDGLLEYEDAFFTYTEIVTEIVEIDMTTMVQQSEDEPVKVASTDAPQPVKVTSTDSPQPVKVASTESPQMTTKKVAPPTTRSAPTTLRAEIKTTETALPLSTEVVSYCLESQFECLSNHHCIPLSMVCDTISDCEDNSDENQEMCVPDRQCSTGYFKCGNSPHCVAEQTRCDGIYHCYNGEDEANCLSCVNMKGVPETLNPEDICDGIQDCHNNMDENKERCGKPCRPGHHKCDDGLQCIKEERVCNGIHNCHDKSDEKQCSQDMLDCWSYDMFACDGICLPQSALCDYAQDCMDSIDEKGCTFKLKTCPKAFEYQPETDSCLHTSLINSGPFDLLQVLDQVEDMRRGEELEERGLMM